MESKIGMNTVAEFTWLFTNEFFLETDNGNFIWSDPDYPNGNNTIRPYDGTIDEYLKKRNIPFGRSKGKHTIEGYCGKDVKFI